MPLSIPHTHVRPDLPPDTWMVGPLDRRGVAAFVAEIEDRVRNERLRPEISAVITDGFAILYVTDPACTTYTLWTLYDHQACIVRQPPAAPHLATRAAVRTWATTPTPGADGAADAVARVERAVAAATGSCKDCGAPIANPAPGFARWTLCKPCWKVRRDAGTARQRALDEAVRERLQEAA